MFKNSWSSSIDELESNKFPFIVKIIIFIYAEKRLFKYSNCRPQKAIGTQLIQVVLHNQLEIFPKCVGACTNLCYNIKTRRVWYLLYLAVCLDCLNDVGLLSHVVVPFTRDYTLSHCISLIIFLMLQFFQCFGSGSTLGNVDPDPGSLKSHPK